MPIDNFATFATAPNDPARDAVAVTPSDVVALPVVPRALYVGTGGTLVVRCIDSVADVTLKNVAAGQILDLRVGHVRATGTTAADIVALA
ncbi:hypothetical protein ASG29_00490 [Sphingomonas sp. Leaf412]|uniref:spike base protein, RCAP_Rcc01079 family n=1 Tax=Sphingomonas sp. Leaf412 TaxID=1736370 RepID=UPI0006F5CCDB|nr:hypothetical protein [Sphingomonas sp. Leaf412]KQT34682.1 hypothetical protein ASG29_00490 [Sphingomonas sp. Leaf412]